MREPECRQCVESFFAVRLHPKNKGMRKNSAAEGFLSSAASFFAKKGGRNMKNIFKKALSFFLAVIMTAGMFPVTAMAEEQYVYFSISLDDKFLEGSDGTVMAHVPVAISELENIKLSDYGLSEYAVDKNGDGKEDITALHLDLYAHDKYCERNGKEIAEQVQGAPGSLYFNSFWSGHDCNLNY